MADSNFNKPTGTESSDSTIQLQNEKMLAIAKMDYSQYTNTPTGVIAFDHATRTFQLKTNTSWEPIQLSLTLGTELEVGSLNADSITTTSLTIPVGGTINAPQITTINSRLNTLEAKTLQFVEGVEGNDFNIVVDDLSQNGTGEISSGTTVFNIPDAGVGKRGVINTTQQSIAGRKTFTEGIQFGNVAIYSTEPTSIKIDGNVGIGIQTNPPTSALQVSEAINDSPDWHGVHLGMSSASDTNEFATIKLCSSSGGVLDFTAPMSEKSARVSYNQDTQTLRLQSNNKLSLMTADVEAVTITNTQKVGIGTSSPTETLDIAQTGTASATLGLKSNNQKLVVESVPTITEGPVTRSGYTRIQSTTQNSPSSPTNLLLQPDGGRVGVGVVNPMTTLHVGGAIQLGPNTTDSYNYVIESESIGANAGTLTLYNGSYSNKSQRLSITSSGKVGIGTFTPQDAVHVLGALRLTGEPPASSWDITSTRIYTQTNYGSRYDSYSHQFDVGTTRKTGLLIQSNGRVGIGTASPENVLHTYTADRGLYGAVIQTYNQQLKLQSYSVHASPTVTNYSTIQSTNSSGVTNNLFLQPDGGKVGIGVSDKLIGETLEVYGNTWVNGNVSMTGGVVIRNTSPTVYFQDTDNRSAMIHVNNNIMYFLRANGTDSSSWEGGAYGDYWPLTINLTNNDAQFGRNVTVPVGSVGIGISTPAAYPLEVHRYSTEGVMKVKNSYSVGRSEIIFANDIHENVGGVVLLGSGHGPTHSNNLNIHTRVLSAISTWTNGIWRNSTDQNGHFIPGGDNTYVLGWAYNRWHSLYLANGISTLSDERTKFEIEDSPLGLNFINSLRPVVYKKKEAQNFVEKTGEVAENGIEKTTTTARVGVRKHCGFIAQQVRDSLPDDSFGVWQLADKNDPESEQALVYEEMIAPMVKAIQELSKKVNDLEAELTELKNNKV